MNKKKLNKLLADYQKRIDEKMEKIEEISKDFDKKVSEILSAL